MPNYERVAARKARKYGINPGVFKRQIKQESGFNPNAKSPAGATGIAQFMPGTAAGLGFTAGKDPERDLDESAKLMAGYVKKYGSMEKALVAYNAGPGAIGKALPAETQGYISTILGGKGSGQTHLNAPSRGATGTRKTTQTATATPGTVSGTAPQEVVDKKGALVAALTSGKPGGNYLGEYVRNIQSGDFTSQTKGTITKGDPKVKVVGGTVIGKDKNGNDVHGVSAAAAAKDLKDLKGVTKFEGTHVAEWIAPILTYARKHGWKGQINSGYRSDAEQTRIYNSGVRPAAVPRSLGGGGSNHEMKAFPGGAVDVSDAAALSAILKKSKYANLLVWAGDKDPVHFSHPHNGSY